MNINNLDQISPDHAGGFDSKHPLEKALNNAIEVWYGRNSIAWYKRRQVGNYFRTKGIKQIFDLYAAKLQAGEQIDITNQEDLLTLIDDVVNKSEVL